MPDRLMSMTVESNQTSFESPAKESLYKRIVRVSMIGCCLNEKTKPSFAGFSSEKKDKVMVNQNLICLTTIIGVLPLVHQTPWADQTGCRCKWLR